MKPAPVLIAAAALAALLVPREAGAAASGLELVQKEFKTAIERATPCTVTVTAKGSEISCSGVVVTKGGLVLSDFDACQVVKARDPNRKTTDQVTVRVPDMKTGAFVEYEGRVVKVLPELDSTLIQIQKPAATTFKFLTPATSAGLHVGQFTFASGSSYGIGAEALPTVTAGVVAAITWRDGGAAGPRLEAVYTGAAVNPGVSGGPLLDVEGRLVGVVSGYVPILPDDPFELLGRVVPIDSLHEAYAAVPEAKDAFDAKQADPMKAPETEALEAVIAHAAAATYPSVASLVVERTTPLSGMTAGDNGKVVALPRYVGPASAVAISDDGWMVTSLYNLTNLAGILAVGAGAGLPPEAKSSAGLAAIAKITAVFPDGTSGAAKLVSYHEGLGIALLKAEVAGRRALEPAPASSYAPGRFLVPVANPFGTKPNRDPLVNFGVVSKRHADDATDPWHGQLQTDAGGTDGNCGAATVDLDGKLVGILTLWMPIHHGRNSGIAFVVPWDRIAPALPEMRAGRSFRLPMLGVMWNGEGGRVTIAGVVKDGPADKAGLKVGDVCVKIGDVAVKSLPECMKAVRGRFAGDKLVLTVDRGGQPVVIEAELGGRD